MARQRFSASCRFVTWVGVTLACVLGTAIGVDAQALKDLQTPDTPLVLKAQGSFFVGGEKVEQTQRRAGRPWSRRTHHRQPDVRAVHGAAGRRRQRAGRDGPRRDVDRQVMGDHAGRAYGLGRILRAQGPSRVRPGPGGARAIGIQSGRLQRRARGLGAAGQSPEMAAIQRRGRMAELPRRSGARSPVSGLAVSGGGPGRAREAGRARRQLRRSAHAEPDVQGAVGSRDSIERRGVDGALAVRPVSAGGRASQSRGRESARARRARPLSGHLHRRTDQDAGDDSDSGRLRRSPRHADRHLDSTVVAAVLRKLSDTHRPHQGGWWPGGDAQPGGPRHPRQQPHDHAGQEQPADR